MPCLLLLLLMMGPRLVLFVIFLLSNYLSKAYSVGLWPFLGFFFLPYTTLAYAISVNSLGGVDGGVGLVVFVLGILLDFGVIGGGASRRRGPPPPPPPPPGGPGTVDENGLKRLN